MSKESPKFELTGSSDDARTLELESFDPRRDASATKPDELIGYTHKNYAFLKVIGESKTTRVYKAHVVPTNRNVAIKTLKFRDHQAIALWRELAPSLINLKHSNIVEVIDYFETPDGRPFLVMELVNGVALSDLLESCEFFEDEEELATAVLKIGSALEHAHRQKVFHTNVNPRNVFLWEDDNGVVVKVMDFGLGRTSLDSQTDLSALDIFQIGVLTYLMVTGQMPYKSLSKSMFIPSDATGKLTPIGFFRSDLYCCEDFSEIIDEALELDDAYRTETITEFTNGIRTWIDTVEKAKVARSQLLDQIVEVAKDGNRLGATTAERNMRTTIRNMLNLRQNQSSQEETLFMRLTEKGAKKGPRLSPQATLLRGLLACLFAGACVFLTYYIYTFHSETVSDLWVKSSRQLSTLLPKRSSDTNEEQLPQEALTETTSSSGQRVRPKPSPTVSQVALRVPIPKTTPDVIRLMYFTTPNLHLGNNTTVDRKRRGFRIDYRHFNREWLR